MFMHYDRGPGGSENPARLKIGYILSTAIHITYWH